MAQREKTKREAALDELLAGKTTDEIAGPSGLLKQLTKALVERAMAAELTHHPGYEKHAPEGRGCGNNRNGVSRKNFTGNWARWRFGCCGTATGLLSRRSFPDTSGDSGDLTRRSFRCTRAG